MYWAIRQLEGDFVIEVDDKVLWSQWKGALVSVDGLVIQNDSMI